MISGVQSLESILGAARTKGEPFEDLVDVPVLVLVSEDADFEPVTAVGGPPPTEGAADSKTTLVIPLQARYPAAGAKAQLSFGRSEVCDVIIPIASVSKHHGYFESMAQTWLVSDVGSTNGTSVGGQVVGKTATELTDGCSLRLGRVIAKFLSPKSFCELLRQRLVTA